MAISSTQRQNAARSRFAAIKPESTVWFWRGYLPGREGQVGIVADSDGVEQRGLITGNIQPRLGAVVQFTPGQPIGAIALPTVDEAGGGGGTASPTAPEERTIGIESPTAGTVYPLVARNDVARVYTALHVVNSNTDGTTATNGTATVLVNGSAASVGSIIPVGARVGLRVDTVGAGILSASVYARLA